MRDAERVESAFRRRGKIPPRNKTGDRRRTSKSNGPVPMEIGIVTLKKQSPAERVMCRKEGPYFRCREKGTWPTSSQKPLGTEPHYGSSYSYPHQ